MDDFVDERDFKLLETDKYTFSVLKRIIKGECRVLLTDHESLIICHTGNPFPTWVWTPDDATDEEMERAFKLTTESCPLGEGYTYNIKYSLADYFIKRAAEEGQKLSIKTNMFAYDCPKLVDESALTKVDGKLHHCTMADLEELTNFKENFHTELQIDVQDRDTYRKDSQTIIGDGHMYLWKNAEGKFVASCNFRVSNNLASLSLVYTLKEFRRRHYAENLVYQVSREAVKQGLLPTLYTDADYAASNACYTKLGYILRGKVCTIG